MLKEKIISLITNPHLINHEDNISLEDITQNYPFFAISHILLSKGLLNTESIRYNRKLKTAALYSRNRKKLFSLITKESEKKEEIISKSKSEIVKEKNSDTQLELGSPLKFNQQEEHSFSEWLSLTKVKKINRSIDKKESFELIDSFIEKKPKILITKNQFFSPTETAKNSLIQNDELVTETLARVYLEQEHFDKAISAYKKLSLKYPKKSSFFADQIKLINDLKKK